MTNKLSPPVELNGNDISEKIKNVYDHFNSLFVRKHTRPRYNDIFIFFNISNWYKGCNLTYPERFMHSVSIEDDTKYTAFPCNNDITYQICTNKCSCANALSEFQLLGRSECPYRLARVHWIPEIINLANQSDPDIKAWTQIETDHKKRKIRKNYIRYESGIVDYVVILKEEWKNDVHTQYTFVTGFPVFMKRNKEQFDESFQKSKKGTVVVTVP